jgi:hypothetical protein
LNLDNVLKIKKPRLYSKLYILQKDEYYSLKTGEKVTRLVATKGTVVQISETSLTNYIVKDKKVNNIPYIYQSKNKKEYIMSQSLTTNYMRKVLFDYYEKNAIVVATPSFLIIFLGYQNQKIIKLNNHSKEEVENMIGNIFQGVKFEHLELATFLDTVGKKTKRLPFVLLGLSLLFFGFMYMQMFEDEEEELKKLQMQHQASQNARPKQKITNQDLLSIIKTNEMIKNLYMLPLEAGRFIGNVEFIQQRVTIFSFAPMQNSFLKDHFFKRAIRFSKNDKYAKIPFELKSAKECIKILGQNKDVIELSSLRENKINFLLRSNEFSPERLDSFLKDIYRCPIQIKEGFIQFVNLKKRNVQINMLLVDANKLKMQHATINQKSKGR